MNPIVRWTIGDVKLAGFVCLRKSIFSFIRIYGSNFRFFVCYNNVQLNKLKSFLDDIPVHLQFILQKTDSVPMNVQWSVWKYCPPRFDPGSHELCVDNDIWFVKPSQAILNFFDSDRTLLGVDNIAWFGRYGNLFQKHEKYNAGLFGLPPGYGFGAELVREWKRLGSFSKLTLADEQGLTSYVLKKQNPILLKSGYLLVKHDCIPELKNKPDIIHFITLNRFGDKHLYWNRWCIGKI